MMNLRKIPGWEHLICLAFLLGSSSVHGDVPLPSINTNNIIVVTNSAYGAIGDGVTTNTTAIQNAINAAAKGGTTNGLSGGTVEIPAGVYLSGPLSLKNYVNLQIDAGAMLQMLPYGSYPNTANPTDFISASKLHDIEISGSGTIDGQGAVWWATNNATSGGISRPKAMFAPSTCTNILVRDVTLQNPPNTHISFRYVCVNVTVNHININTTNPSPNTDGIDCSGANVLIENSHISDGDDHIAMGDGNVGNLNHDFTITNCLFGAGHGVSIGSYTSGGLSNLLVINCVWTNGTSGIHLKADDGRGGLVQNLRYINLAMTNTQIPIFLYSYYTNSGTSSGATVGQAAAYPVLPVTSETPIWRNILISNLTAVPASGNPAGIIWGKPEMSFSNVVMDHVNITATKYFQLYNAQGVQLIDSQIMVAPTNAFAFFNANLTVTNRLPSTSLVKLEGISTNGFVNTLLLYGVQAIIHATNALMGSPNLTLGGSTLTISNSLSLSPSNIIYFVLGTNTSTISVKGNLILGGTNNINAGSGYTNGVYTLITYSGTLNGNLPTLGSVPAGYAYSLNTNTPGQVNLLVTLLAPSNFIATASNLLINLKWNAVNGASGYNLKRGTVSGNYPTVLSGLTTTNFADANVVNAVNYFYVVSAAGSGGESSNSLEVVAAPLPSNQPTNIIVQVSDGQMLLAWPQDHQGWRLQIQTNSLALGLGTNWVTVSNSTSVNQSSIPIDPGNSGVFFRLIYP
jgi:hypothetical protein